MAEHSPTADVAAYDDSNDYSLDVVFDLLANQRRRHALSCLANHTQAMTLTDLAEGVAVRENEDELTEIPRETVRTVSTSLYHVHLPKLADAGTVEFDRERDLIRVSETADQVERVRSFVTDSGEER